MHLTHIQPKKWRSILLIGWNSTLGALKTRRCSGLDSWIVHAWSHKTRRCSRLDSWIIPAWSLKNKQVFQIGLVYRPRVLFRIGPPFSHKNGEGVLNRTQMFSSARDLKLWENVHLLNVSHVHVSRVMCHFSCVTCPMSNVPFLFLFYGRFNLWSGFP